MKNNFKSTLNVGLIIHHLSEINMLVNLLIVSLYFRFYPFHYAPYMSDIRNFGEMLIQFELCTPFLPFEQLLAVLPAASRQLLPKPFQVLLHSYKWFYVFFYTWLYGGRKHTVCVQFSWSKALHFYFIYNCFRTVTGNCLSPWFIPGTTYFGW